MSACDDYSSNFPLYLDNELSGDELENLRIHLMSCADCREALEEQQTLSYLLRRSRPLYPVPERFRDCVLRIVNGVPDESEE